MRQADRILAHLIDTGRITSREAMLDYGVMQTPRCIKELRQRGYPIRTTYRHVVNRYGERVRIGEFVMEVKS
jgi:hypothetical protein